MNKLITIRNDVMSVTVNAMGAEVWSILRNDGRELLWQGNADIWADRAPLMFPLVGRLKGGAYTHGGNAYAMDIHGFAKDSPFDIIQQSDTSMSFELKRTDATAAMYPFDFTLTVTYTLDGNTLRKSHVIENRGEQAMYYELGGHEGYNIAVDGDAMRDCFLRFPGKDTIHTYTTDVDIMVNKDATPIALDGDKLMLAMELFKGDALIFDDRAGKCIELHSAARGHLLTVQFDDFAYCGVWTRYREADSQYVCIEPWSSLPDCNFIDTELEQKIGVRTVQPHASETMTYTITLA